MTLIVGLGNPGEKYEKTRHNLGFMVLDELAKKLQLPPHPVWQKSSRFNTLMIKFDNLILAKPQTHMNASGFSVAKIARFYKIKPGNIWVVHDEIDLTLGRIKIRKSGGSAGHRGVESVIEELGTNQFVHFRLGIGRPPATRRQAVEDYVLSAFSHHQLAEVKRMIKKAVIQIKADLKK